MIDTIRVTKNDFVSRFIGEPCYSYAFVFSNGTTANFCFKKGTKLRTMMTTIDRYLVL